VLAAAIDAALPEGAMRLAKGIPETAALGQGELSVEIVRVAAVA
jgi:hypothetical protein